MNNEEKPFWKNVNIPVYPNSLWNNTDSLSIEETILYWRRTFPPVGTNSSFQQLLIRQTCTEPHCARDVCPEKLNYNITSVFSWKDWERAVVATAVLVVLLLSIAVFVCLKIHHCLLKHRQQVFMDSHHPYERLLSEQEYGPLSVRPTTCSTSNIKHYFNLSISLPSFRLWVGTQLRARTSAIQCHFRGANTRYV